MDTNYVVVVHHTFDPEITVYECGKEYDKAKDFLRKIWTEYYNEELSNHSELNEYECYCEEDYARIGWTDGDTYTDFDLIATVKGE